MLEILYTVSYQRAGYVPTVSTLSCAKRSEASAPISLPDKQNYLIIPKIARSIKSNFLIMFTSWTMNGSFETFKGWVKIVRNPFRFP